MVMFVNFVVDYQIFKIVFLDYISLKESIETASFRQMCVVN